MDNENARHNTLIWDELWGLPGHMLPRRTASPRLCAIADRVTAACTHAFGPRPDPGQDPNGCYRWRLRHAEALHDLVLDTGAYPDLRADLMQPDVYAMLKADRIVPMPDWDGYQEDIPPHPTPGTDGPGIGI